MMRSKHDGYTLVEVLAVIALLGLSVSIVFAATRHQTPRAKAQFAADLLAADLRRGRMAAIMQGVRIEFSISSNGYSSQSLGVDRNLPSSVHLTTSFSENGPLSFHPSGWSDGGQITLEADGAQFNIVVSPVTGRVIVK